MNKLKDLLLEKMTFKQLLALSDDGRRNRSKNINTRSLKVTSDNNSESWTFSYKSNPSTTGKRHQGYIKFLKPDINQNKQALEWNCIVDCTCPDFKFRFAYNTEKQGASITGNNSWNKNNGNTPLPINNKIGLCKHLISLTDYLKTEIRKRTNIKENSKTLNEINNLLLKEIDNPKLKDYQNILKKLIDQYEKLVVDIESNLKKSEIEIEKIDNLGNISIKPYLDKFQELNRELEITKNELNGLKLFLNNSMNT